MTTEENEKNLALAKEKKPEILSIPPEVDNEEEAEKNENVICDFIIKERLGSGTFGTVKLAINRQTEETVAIKILERKKIYREKDKIRLDNEIKILKSLRHPNIVHLFADIQTKPYIYLIMEYIQGTELLKYISLNSKLKEEDACYYFRQIISAIDYLHELKIAHRDIKPENMIIENSTQDIKLVDFGLSSYYNTNNELLSSACGSPSYAAPEMLTGKKYNARKIDVWSCGIVLYAMICGYLPFEDYDQDILFKKIKEGKFKIPEHVSDDAQDLLKKILVTNPKKRYTIEQIKNHKWFNLISNKCLYEGLLLNKYVVPLDESIIEQMNIEYNIKKEKIRACLLNNDHNDITTIYYLILLKNSKLKKESVADLKGKLFKKYLEDNKNLLSRYDNDINNVIEKRKYSNVEEDDDYNPNNNQDNEEKNNIENNSNLAEEENNINNNENENMENSNNNGNNKDIRNEDNKISKPILNSNQNKKKIQKIKKIKYEEKAGKNITPEKDSETKKFMGNIGIKPNRNYSASKRTYIPKIIKKEINDIKSNIYSNKSRSIDKKKNSTKKKNIKIYNPNQHKEKKSIKKENNNNIKSINNNNIKEIKPEIKKEEEKEPINKLIENQNSNKNNINNKNELNKTTDITLNNYKENKNNIYKPNSMQKNTIKFKAKIRPDDKKNKTFIIQNSNSSRVRQNKSADKRKYIKNNKNNNIKKAQIPIRLTSSGVKKPNNNQNNKGKLNKKYKK